MYSNDQLSHAQFFNSWRISINLGLQVFILFLKAGNHLLVRRASSHLQRNVTMHIYLEPLQWLQVDIYDSLFKSLTAFFR